MITDLLQFSFEIILMLILGGIIGFVCRGRIVLELLLSVVVSAAYVVIGGWMAGTLSNQISLDDPVGSFYWIGPLYVEFLLLPAVVSATVVGWLRRRRLVSGIRRQ